MTHPTTLQGTLLAMASGLCYGTVGYFGIQLIAAGLSVSSMLFWRFVLASLALLPFVLPVLTKKSPHQKIGQEIGGIFVLGALFYSSSAAFYFIASQHLGTGLAMVLFFSYPAFVVAFSWIMQKKPPEWTTLLSIACVILGCVLIADIRILPFAGAGSFAWAGLGYAILSAVTYAVYMMGSKRYATAMPPLLATFIVCIGNMVAFFVMAQWESYLGFGGLTMPHLPSEWLSTGAMAIVSTLLPILLLLQSLTYISANKASVLSVFEPIITVIIGAALLNEPMSVIQIIGGGCILLGAALIQR